MQSHRPESIPPDTFSDSEFSALFYEAFVADDSHVVLVTVWGVMADRFYTQGSKALDCDGFPTVKLMGFDLGVDKKVFPAVAKLESLSNSCFVFEKTEGSCKC